MNDESKFYPTADEYNAENYDNEPVTLDHLEHLVYIIIAKTGLSYNQVTKILKLYFNEIRTEVLKGKIAYLGNLGTLYCKFRPNKRSKDKFNIRIAFKSSKQLIKKVRYNAIFR